MIDSVEFSQYNTTMNDNTHTKTQRIKIRQSCSFLHWLLSLSSFFLFKLRCLYIKRFSSAGYFTTYFKLILNLPNVISKMEDTRNPLSDTHKKRQQKIHHWAPPWQSKIMRKTSSIIAEYDDVSSVAWISWRFTHNNHWRSIGENETNLLR